MFNRVHQVGIIWQAEHPVYHNPVKLPLPTQRGTAGVLQKNPEVWGTFSIKAESLASLLSCYKDPFGSATKPRFCLRAKPSKIFLCITLLKLNINIQLQLWKTSGPSQKFADYNFPVEGRTRPLCPEEHGQLWLQRSKI